MPDLETRTVPRVLVLRVGKGFPAKTGPFTVTRRMLTQIAESMNALVGVREAVVQLGHGDEQALVDEEELPALGMGRNWTVDGKGLYVDLAGVPAKLAKALDLSAYPFRSLGLKRDHEVEGKTYPWFVQHIALLGRVQPAVSSMIGLPESVAAGRMPETFDELMTLYEASAVSVPDVTEIVCCSAVIDTGEARTDITFALTDMDVRRLAEHLSMPNEDLREKVLAALASHDPDSYRTRKPETETAMDAETRKRIAETLGLPDDVDDEALEKKIETQAAGYKRGMASKLREELGLDDDADVLEAVREKIEAEKEATEKAETVTASMTDMDKRLKTAEAQLSAVAKEKAETLIQTAIDQGQVKADHREKWVDLALDNYDNAATLIGDLQPRVELGEVGTSKGKKGELPEIEPTETEVEVCLGLGAAKTEQDAKVLLARQKAKDLKITIPADHYAAVAEEK